MSKFTIECTLPPEGTTFVQDPNARGTLNIVYSCLAVVFLCTWGIQHLNVPVQTIPNSKWQKSARTVSRVSTKVKWMAFNILAPEWPFAQPVCGLVSERAFRKAFDGFKEEDEVPWTGSHTQLANMGGFIIRFDQSLHNHTHHEDVGEQNEDSRCVVDDYCCNWPNKIGPRSLWSRLFLRKTGIRVKIRSAARDSGSMAMRPGHLSTHVAGDNLRSSPPKQDHSTDSIVPHVYSEMDSFDQVIHAEDQSMPSLPVHASQNEESSAYQVEANLSRQAALAKVLDTLRMCCSYGWGCPHDIRTYRWSGETTWKLDATNVKIARAAIETLGLQHFGGESKVSLIKSILSSNPTVWLTNLRVLCGNRWSLDANQLLYARRLGIVDKLPSLTEDEIEDLNKSDFFVKFLAVSQILWLCIQLCSRLARHIPTTQLEVVTLAFTICSIFTYFLFLSRPKDVQTVREIGAVRYPTPPEIAQIAAAGPSVFGFCREAVAVPNNAIHRTKGRPFMWSSCILMIIFGALHVVSWNYEFPTQVERTLWRASIVITIIAVPLLLFGALLTRISFRRFTWPPLRQAPRFLQFATFIDFFCIGASFYCG
ncbi:hypothetical protein Q7P37_007241 [Cladosporium fusiforme]